MDFLDSKKKKAHRIRLLLGYALMAVALGISTLLIVLLTAGYGFDRDAGVVIQNGLAIVGANPESADLYVNDKLRGKTEQRLFLPEGNYNIKLQRKGYRNWEHKVTLEGSIIEHLLYPFMFPEKLKTTTLKTENARPAFVSQSPNRKHLLQQNMDKLGSFFVTDLNDTKNPSTEINLPTDSYVTSGTTHNFKEIEWASDNTNVLVEHTYANGVEYILINHANVLQSLNISKLFPAQSGFKISLLDKKTDQFYLFNESTKSLMSGNINTKQVTPLLAHAVQFITYKNDTILYVNDKNEVHLTIKDKNYFIRTLPASPNYLLDYAVFDGDVYLICGSPIDGKTYVYANPLNNLTKTPSKPAQPHRVLVTEKTEYVKFSANARFISAQAGSKFAVFDAETGRQFRFDTKLALESAEKAVWMDGHRLAIASAEKLYVFDFDGTNVQELGSILNKSQPFFNRDYDAFFTYASADGKINFIRTELLVK